MLGDVFDAAGDNMRVSVWGVQWMQQMLPARASPVSGGAVARKAEKGPERVSKRPGGCTGAVRRAGQYARSKHSVPSKYRSGDGRKGCVGGEGPYRHHAVALRLS